MRNKKNKTLLLTLATLMSGCMLAGCGEVSAEPSDKFQEETIVKFEEKGDKVYNNEMLSIYNALVKPGDHNSEKIMNNLLDLYAQSTFGDFYKIKEAFDKNDQKALQEIADSHAVYQNADKKGDIKRLTLIYTQILYQLKTSFLSDTKNGSYQERSLFNESKFFNDKLKNFNIPDNGEHYVEPVKVDASTRVEKTTNADELKPYFKDLFVTYKKYIELDVLPKIYKKMLVAEYLYNENYKSLGQSYARNIDVISASESTRFPGATKNLVRAYCDIVLETEDENIKKEINGKYDFRFFDRLVKGLPFDAEAEETKVAEKIYKQAGWYTFEDEEHKDSYKGYEEYKKSANLKEGTNIYVQSNYGGIIERYIKIFDNSVDHTAVWNDFTGNNTYAKNIGLMLKERNIVSSTNAINGWYTKSTIGSAVPGQVSSRLFKIDVANEVDKKNHDKDTMGKFINNSFYMTPENYEDNAKYPYLIEDGKQFYIVRVNEAVMLSKLQKSALDNGSNYYGDEKAEEIARSIALLMSSGDTYKSDSNKYYIKKMALEFHDQTVYDYFSQTFPGIFE